MPSSDLLLEKLIKMKEYLEQLKRITPGSYPEYLNDLIAKYAVERLIQLSVDLALDINNIILSHLRKPPAADYFSSFMDLAANGVLEESFAARIAPSAGLRNRLIHEYERINDEIVYQSASRLIELYTLYMKAINQFLAKME
jgi:uncharacterized protein YutE (UPF0331/DUF86 family)